MANAAEPLDGEWVGTLIQNFQVGAITKTAAATLFSGVRLDRRATKLKQRLDIVGRGFGR
jgi:hypothetical protein